MVCAAIGGVAGARGVRRAQLWGVRDMHGLTWEWVEDFAGSLVSGDNRQLGDRETERFCGGASASAADVRNYAAFMRYAMRTSVEADYAIRNMGFRCASDP